MAYAQGFNASGQFLEETSAIEQGIHKAVINIDRIQSLQSHILVSTSTEKEGSYGEE
ncbi:9199_t:CDS:1, partial [Funneliformis caledonium]